MGLFDKKIRDECGWVLTSTQPAPNFCPQCGDSIDFRDKM